MECEYLINEWETRKLDNGNGKIKPSFTSSSRIKMVQCRRLLDWKTSDNSF